MPETETEEAESAETGAGEAALVVVVVVGGTGEAVVAGPAGDLALREGVGRAAGLVAADTGEADFPARVGGGEIGLSAAGAVLPAGETDVDVTLAGVAGLPADGAGEADLSAAGAGDEVLTAGAREEAGLTAVTAVACWDTRAGCGCEAVRG